MNREIKFKAFYKINDTNQRVWTYYGIGTKPIIIGAHWIVEDLQFTGLKDKKGKEIYEGDIMRGDGLYKNHTDKVEWVNGGFIRYGHYNGGLSGVNITHGLTFFEIIGNIWENGDLLKVTK